MFAFTVFLSVLASAFHGSDAAAHLTMLSSARASLAKPGEDAKKEEENPIKKGADVIVKATKEGADNMVKVMLDPISVMRGELCWARHNMVGHEDCMKWLVEECQGHSFGTGLCTRVRKLVKDECMSKEEKEEGHKKKACDYAKELGIDIPADTDGDGVFDKDDAFPKDPKETKDTDGDGVGDNADECPKNPERTKKPCKETTTAAPAAPAAAALEKVAAPAPAPAAAEKEPPAGVEPAKAVAPAPAKKEEAAAAPAPAKKAPEPPAKKEPAAKAAASTKYEDPSAKEGLASQGFSGKPVIHTDGETVTGDWGDEYGHHEDKPKKSGGQTGKLHPLMYLVGAVLAMVYTA